MAKGISLHIGLNSVDPNHYQGWNGALQACENDAHDMAEIAKAQGISAETLLTPKATITAVLNHLDKAADALAPGDLFVLSYSGHGSKAPDLNSDEFDDGEDETWCLYDGQLIDDQIYHAFGRFKKGVRITMFSDSCHSGTVARFVSEFPSDLNATATRLMPPQVAYRTYHANREYYDSILLNAETRDAWLTVEASVLLFAACQDNQTALDGTFNGMFTGNLLRAWNRGGFQGGHRAFFDSIAGRSPQQHMPNYFQTGRPLEGFDTMRPFTV